ncbi:MAG TPA: hypothetical protein VKT82_20980 [Ktedonobacterales bacterium]|nr:hypothetical protein [Ktedonobacterales bacterium]
MRAPQAASRWSKFGRVLLPGIPLGLLQLGLVVNGFAIAGFRPVRLDWPQSIAVGALFYLIIAAIAGFFTTWRHGGKASDGARAGLYGGAVSLCIVVLFAVIVIVAILLSPAAPNRPPARTLVLPPVLGALLAGLILAFVIFLNALGALLAYPSGLLGGWLGQRTPALLTEREPAS